MHNTCCDNTHTEISQFFVKMPYALRLENEDNFYDRGEFIIQNYTI